MKSKIKLTTLAIFVKNAKNIQYKLVNCTFIHNEVEEDGASIYFNPDSGGYLTVIDSKFINNTALKASHNSNGGAINILNGNLFINGSYFEHNIAYGYGGAIYADCSDFSIYNSKFLNNRADKEKYGGAVYVKNNIYEVRNTSFIGNRAEYGGAIYIENSNKEWFMIEDCNFDGNLAIASGTHVHGGAIYNEGNKFEVKNSNFTNNAAKDYDDYETGRSAKTYSGGAIYTNKEITLNGCVFKNNFAEDEGGALYANDGINWGEPSVFDSNSVNNNNNAHGNKGGAVYANKFNNNPNGLVFINNRAWYGGAVYIHNKNEVTFESCYFTDNVAKHRSKPSSGYGAAIYMDSASSKLSLINNIFSNNQANQDKGVYNCGVYGTIENNWWGTNDPNFDEGYLVEWHRFESNDNRKDSKPLKIVFTCDSQTVGLNTTLTLKFVDNEGADFTGKLINWDASFTANKNATFTSKHVEGNKVTVVFSPLLKQDYQVTAQVILFTVSLGLKTDGDFNILQNLVNNADGVLNLTRNYTYSIGRDTIKEGIEINKPLTINGNGYTIDALGFSRIFLVVAGNVEINNVNFVNGKSFAGAAIRAYSNFVISNCNFTSNFVESNGGAVYAPGADSFISNCIFEYNRAYGRGGAIAMYGQNSNVINSKFINNSAVIDGDGGAIYIETDRVNVLGSEFQYNSAARGSAIGWVGKNGTVKNSIFLNNRANFKEFSVVNTSSALIFTVASNENYINAIASVEDLLLSNVTYWNGNIVSGDNPNKTNYLEGINITLEVYKGDASIKKANLISNASGQVRYNYYELEEGNYTFKAYHAEDSYYASSNEITGNFEVKTRTESPSSVTINIPFENIFYYGDCNISFTVANKTAVRVVVTDRFSTKILIDEYVENDYILVDLPADNDNSYKITVYNIGNETFAPSSAEAYFYIYKAQSTIKINPVPDVIAYGENLTVTFVGDTSSYNVTVYDKDNEVVFTQLTDKTTVTLPVLNVGSYNLTIINLGSQGRYESRNSTSFNVSSSAINNVVVAAENVTYGNNVTIKVSADVDGIYTLYVNSSKVDVNVTNKVGSVSLLLGAGNYYANVTFNSTNYVNNVTNATFTIRKAQSEVYIYDGNLEEVTVGEVITVYLDDEYPALYNVTIKGNDFYKNFTVDTYKFTLPELAIGEYNLTVVNLGNENITGSSDWVWFTVSHVNYVEVIAFDSDYGRNITIYVQADVDGDYAVDINGTDLVIKVEDGIGFYEGYLELDAGDYYANVTFDNPNYINVITNDTFTVFVAESSIRIYEIGNVTYGEDIIVNFYDNSPAIFYIEVNDTKGEVFNTTFEFEDKNPEMFVELSGLAAGEYIVTIYNLGNENIDASWDSTTFNVVKATPVIEVDSFDVTYPDDVVVFISGTASGNYTVKVGNLTQKVIFVAGEISQLIFEDLPAGEYVVNVTYEESENYTSAFNDRVNVTVAQNDDFDMDIDTNESGDITTLIINFPNDATGNVTVIVNGKDYYYANITNGTAIVDIANLNEDDEIEVIYSGDENYHAKDKNTTDALINSKIVAQDMTRGYNSGSDYQVTFVDKSGKALANATLTFTVNGKNYTATTDANGVAFINPKLTVGTYTVSVINPYNKEKTTNTIKIVTRITGNKNVNTYYGKNYQYKLRIIGNNGSPVGANVAVKVTINGKVKTLKTDKNGYITVKFTKAYLPKTYTVTAEYYGVKVSNKVKVQKVLTLKKVTVKRSAKKLVLKATLKEGKKALKGKKVVFKFKGKKYTAKTNKKGVAKVTIKKKVLQKLKKGKKVTYQVTYLKNTVKRTAKVKR